MFRDARLLDASLAKVVLRSFHGRPRTSNASRRGPVRFLYRAILLRVRVKRYSGHNRVVPYRPHMSSLCVSFVTVRRDL